MRTSPRRSRSGGRRTGKTPSFAATSGRTGEGLAAPQASSRLAECWQERRLADDLPALVRHELESISPEVLAKIRHAAESGRTTRFATHPSDADRIAAAAAADAPAGFSSDLPATALFQDFAGLCREASKRHYRETIGIRFDPRNLVPVADLLGWGTNVEAELDEFDAGRVSLHDRVRVTAEGYDGQFWKGEVEEIPDAVVGRRLKPQDPGKPEDTRVLLVKIAFQEPTPLKLGQRVEIRIE